MGGAHRRCAFGGDIDYAILVKVYGAAPEGQRRYSPAICTGAHKYRIEGNPDAPHSARLSVLVMRGLGPRIHLLRTKVHGEEDGLRVKPGNDSLNIARMRMPLTPSGLARGAEPAGDGGPVTARSRSTAAHCIPARLCTAATNSPVGS